MSAARVPSRPTLPSSSNLSAHRTSAQTYSYPQSTTSQFKYTLDNDRLTYAQRQFYEDNGFLVIPKLFKDYELDEYEQRFVDVCEKRVSLGNMTLMKDISFLKTNKDGLQVYYKLQDIIWDDVLSKYTLHPKLLDIVECFTGKHITAKHSMLINKPPDSGTLSSRHPPHQDLYYFPFRPEDRIVATWTAMEKVTPENGCLYVVPGTHKGKLLHHEYPKWEGGVNKAFHGILDYEDYPKTTLTMEKGDTVFFHPLLIHGSGPNLTKGFRKAISCHYASTECYYIDVKGTLQEGIAKEVEAMTLRRGHAISFKDVWEYRSRHVRGPKAQL